MTNLNYLYGTIFSILFPFQSTKRVIFLLSLIIVAIICFYLTINDIVRFAALAAIASAFGAMRRTEKARASIDPNALGDLDIFFGHNDWQKVENGWINTRKFRYFEDLRVTIKHSSNGVEIIGPMSVLSEISQFLKNFDRLS